MIIIVEGPDGSGKSELIKELLKSYPGSNCRHFGAPKTDEEAENYWKQYVDAILATNPNTVTLFDRSWYSDLVYAPIMRGKCEMDLRHVRMLEALVKDHGGGHVIYCVAPSKILWERCIKRGETYIKTKDQLINIANDYETVMKSFCTLPVVRNVTAW